MWTASCFLILQNKILSKIIKSSPDRNRTYDLAVNSRSLLPTELQESIRKIVNNITQLQIQQKLIEHAQYKLYTKLIKKQSIIYSKFCVFFFASNMIISRSDAKGNRTPTFSVTGRYAETTTP